MSMWPNFSRPQPVERKSNQFIKKYKLDKILKYIQFFKKIFALYQGINFRTLAQKVDFDSQKYSVD